MIFNALNIKDKFSFIVILIPILLIVSCVHKPESKHNQLESHYKSPKSNSERTPHFIAPVESEYDQYFQIAVDEISDMINGIKPINYKRAVFLVENAFDKGALDWDEFNNKLDSITTKLKQMIKNLVTESTGQQGIGQYLLI